MQVVVEVTSEFDTGRRTWLRPGQTIKIGRGGLADFSLSDDLMSTEHFAIECSSDSCLLRDLNSSNGTSVNGKRVNEVLLSHGDRIQAGQTSFLVHVTGAIAGAPSDSEIAPVLAPRADSGRTTLTNEVITEAPLSYLGKTTPLYAILDAARNPMVLSLLIQSDLHYESLYEGPKAGSLAAVAPYLVEFPPDSPWLEKILEEGWGDSWGVFLTGDESFENIRKHLRRFLTVKTDAEKPVYFRFYDPRVLRVFLPTCLPNELTQFFGPVTFYFVEDESPEKILRFAALANVTN